VFRPYRGRRTTRAAAAWARPSELAFVGGYLGCDSLAIAEVNKFSTLVLQGQQFLDSCLAKRKREVFRKKKKEKKKKKKEKKKKKKKKRKKKEKKRKRKKEKKKKNFFVAIRRKKHFLSRLQLEDCRRRAPVFGVVLQCVAYPRDTCRVCAPRRICQPRTRHSPVPSAFFFNVAHGGVPAPQRHRGVGRHNTRIGGASASMYCDAACRLGGDLNPGRRRLQGRGCSCCRSAGRFADAEERRAWPSCPQLAVAFPGVTVSTSTVPLATLPILIDADVSSSLPVGKDNDYFFAKKKKKRRRKEGTARSQFLRYLLAVPLL
jgi:hypothetical protein